MNYITECGYSSLTPGEKATICNGAGAAGDWRSKLIPNTLYGLDCADVFDIHDYGYYVGISREDKDRIDMCMLINLFTKINSTGGFLKILRLHRALKYYIAVNELGDEAFFIGDKHDRVERSAL